MSIKAGLLGFGMAGRLFHAPLLEAAGFSVAAIATSRTAEARAAYPSADVLEDSDAACAHPDVDLVVVATPDRTHTRLTRLALEAGKHVVVEKPFTESCADARALIDLAKARGRLLSVFQNRRWDVDFLTLRKLVSEGALGEVVHYAARWDRYRPQAKGVWRDLDMRGELFGLGPHLVDQALVLFGTPDWIFADVANQRGVTSQNDSFEIVMGKGRARITLAVNYLASDNLRGLRVIGDKATFVKAGLDPQEDQLKAAMAPIDASYGHEDENLHGVLTEGASGASRVVASERGDWLAYYRGVARAIETGAPPPVTAEEGARVIGVLEAAVESSNTGKRVDLPAFLAENGV